MEVQLSCRKRLFIENKKAELELTVAMREPFVSILRGPVVSEIKRSCRAVILL
jgi:hypothetical protein